MPLANPSAAARRTCLASLAVALAVASDGSAATRQSIIPAGKFSAPDGRPASETGGKVKQWVLTEKLHQQVKQMAVAGGRDICVDYEHALIKKQPFGEKAPASGWVPDADNFAALSWDNTGGLIADINWTPAAAQHIRDKEFKYLSPVFFYDDTTGDVLGLHSIALTNNPALSQLAVAALSAELNLPNLPNQGEHSMSGLYLAICAALGVATAASEETVLTEINALKARVAAPPDAEKFVARATLTAEQAAHADVRTKLAALEAQVMTSLLDGEIAAAKNAGAALTAEFEADVRSIAKTMGVEVAKRQLDALPKIAALAGKTQTGGTVPAGSAKPGAAGLTEGQRSMAALCGVTEEQYAAELALTSV